MKAFRWWNRSVSVIQFLSTAVKRSRDRSRRWTDQEFRFGSAAQVLETRAMLSSITVTSALDVAGAHTGVTLRDAVNQANQTPGADTINFAPGLNGTKIQLALGKLQITDTVTFQGNGARSTIVDGAGKSRLFDVSGAATSVTFVGMTLTGGKTTANNDSGAAIRFLSNATLTITNSAITNNLTTGSGATGGAIYSNLGLVTISGSTLSGNRTTGAMASGGAIFAVGGTVTLTNSTVAANSTAGQSAYGGGIASPFGAITLISSTVAKNSTTGLNSSAGGIYSRAGKVTLQNSILAQNTVVSGGYPDIFSNFPLGATVTASHSLIGNRQGTLLAYAPVGKPDANGNLIGAPNAPIDPKLGALAYNGGATQTMALLAGSPALDAAGITALLFDQRGTPYSRILNGKLDMGAIER